MDLEELRKEILACNRCPLRRYATHPVPGEGRPGAKLMLVGEAPGKREDELGRPFVGRAGRLLRNTLRQFGIDDVYITNVVKCRPPRNRTPRLEEIRVCGQFLEREIEIVRPRAIVALGRVAAGFFLGKPASIYKIRGKVFEYRGIPVIPTYHPAAVLRNPPLGDAFREDIEKARRIANAFYA